MNLRLISGLIQFIKAPQQILEKGVVRAAFDVVLHPLDGLLIGLLADVNRSDEVKGLQKIGLNRKVIYVNFDFISEY